MYVVRLTFLGDVCSPQYVYKDYEFIDLDDATSFCELQRSNIDNDELVAVEILF